MREALRERQQRTQTIISRLRRAYPDAHCALNYSSPLELLVATILSAQCTDRRVNLVTPALFAQFPNSQAYADAPLLALEKMIQSTGFFRAKAKSLKGAGALLVEKFNGEVPADLDALQALPGVGRKTANVVLGNAFQISSGIVVDTHVKRLAFRLNLTLQISPEKIEIDLKKLVPERHWIMFSHWLIAHGREICKARRPLCGKCPLADVCPKIGVELKD